MGKMRESGLYAGEKKFVLNFVWRSQRRKAVLEGTSLTTLAMLLLSRPEGGN
jgi:hypothetical protein